MKYNMMKEPDTVRREYFENLLVMKIELELKCREQENTIESLNKIIQKLQETKI